MTDESQKPPLAHYIIEEDEHGLKLRTFWRGMEGGGAFGTTDMRDEFTEAGEQYVRREEEREARRLATERNPTP